MQKDLSTTDVRAQTFGKKAQNVARQNRAAEQLADRVSPF